MPLVERPEILSAWLEQRLVGVGRGAERENQHEMHCRPCRGLRHSTESTGVSAGPWEAKQKTWQLLSYQEVEKNREQENHE